MYVQMPGRPGKDIWLADSCSKRVQEGCAFQWRFLRDLGEGQCKVGLRLVHGGRRKTKKIHLQIVGGCGSEAVHVLEEGLWQKLGLV